MDFEVPSLSRGLLENQVIVRRLEVRVRGNTCRDSGEYTMLHCGRLGRRDTHAESQMIVRTNLITAFPINIMVVRSELITTFTIVTGSSEPILSLH